MFNKYTVITKTINKDNGEDVNWKLKDTEKEAIDLFYNNCSSYGTNPATKACEVIVLEPNGNIFRMEQIDNSKYIEQPKVVTAEQIVAKLIADGKLAQTDVDNAKAELAE